MLGWDDGAADSVVASQLQGPHFNPEISFCVEFHMSSVWLSSQLSSFLPSAKIMPVGVFGYTMFPLGVNECVSVIPPIVSHSQTSRLMAEGLDSIAVFIGQGQSEGHVKQPHTSQLVLFSVMFRSVKM